MLEKLMHIIEQYEKLQASLMDPKVASNVKESIRINKELIWIKTGYNLACEYKKFDNQLQEAKIIMEEETDKDVLDMAKEQKKESEDAIEQLEEKIKIALLPKDPNDDKNIFLEIRPAAWGDEAWLFATELLRMYLWFSQNMWRKSEIIEEQLSDIGGIKSVTVKIAWDQVYSVMKFESWVHRVQRIPDTESQWRVHTSTITVAIMPEVEDVSVDLNPADVIIDTYAASSAWGQNANKNQTWVRLHHKPTGIMVTIWDSKSQLQNKEKAFQILKAKLYQIEIDKQQKEQKEIRWNQIGTWDRSEKIRTYNFPQDRITDHRIKKSWSNIPDVLSGNLKGIIQEIIIENQTKLLEAQWNK